MRKSKILSVLTEEEGEDLTPEEQLEKFDLIRRKQDRTTQPMPADFLK